MRVVLSFVLTCPEFHLIMEGKMCGYWKMCIDREFHKNYVVGQNSTLSQPLHISFWRDKNSVHILEFEERM